MGARAKAAVRSEEDIWAEFDNVPAVEDIVKNSTPLDLAKDPEFVAGCLKAQFVEDIYKAMEAQGINKNKLAKKLGKSPQYVGRVLNEKANFTLETLAEIACALDRQVTARMCSREERMTILPANKQPDLTVLSGTTPVIRQKTGRTKMSCHGR